MGFAYVWMPCRIYWNLWKSVERVDLIGFFFMKKILKIYEKKFKFYVHAKHWCLREAFEFYFYRVCENWLKIWRLLIGRKLSFIRVCQKNVDEMSWWSFLKSLIILLVLVIAADSNWSLRNFLVFLNQLLYRWDDGFFYTR